MAEGDAGIVEFLSIVFFVEIFFGSVLELVGGVRSSNPVRVDSNPSRIEKNTTILSNRSKILQKRNKHSDYHVMIKYLSNYNNFIVNGLCN